MQQKEIPLRSQQLKENCWAVEDIYPTEEAWSQALSESASLPEELAAYQGKLGESAETLLSYLTRMEEISHQADSSLSMPCSVPTRTRPIPPTRP